ncbi:hypothetical protein [Ideonella sp.]|uniref:hypothetical protein n=1 Tax=Ideonella sp. TaxID=1929293 RepID=UPI003BB4935D
MNQGALTDALKAVVIAGSSGCVPDVQPIARLSKNLSKNFWGAGALLAIASTGRQTQE